MHFCHAPPARTPPSAHFPCIFVLRKMLRAFSDYLAKSQHLPLPHSSAPLAVGSIISRSYNRTPFHTLLHPSSCDCKNPASDVQFPQGAHSTAFPSDAYAIAGKGWVGTGTDSGVPRVSRYSPSTKALPQFFGKDLFIRNSNEGLISPRRIHFAFGVLSYGVYFSSS